MTEREAKRLARQLAHQYSSSLQRAIYELAARRLMHGARSVRDTESFLTDTPEARAITAAATREVLAMFECGRPDAQS